MLVTLLPSAGDDAHGKHEQRKGHDRIGDPTDELVDPAAVEAGHDAGKPAEDEDQRHGKDGDREIEPRRHDHPAEYVAAELIRAEPVFERRRLQGRSGVAHQRIEGTTDGPISAAITISTNSTEAIPVTGIFRDDVPGMSPEARRGRRIEAQRHGRLHRAAGRDLQTRIIHLQPSTRMRGSITP